MDKATDKQIYFLKTQGIDANMLSKQAASEMIKNIKESPSQENVPVVKPGQPTQGQWSQPVVVNKKSYDTKSYYVSYAKDICVALLQPTSGFEASAEECMQKAINVVKMAREQL